MAIEIPPLQHKEEFRNLLANYHPTEEARNLFGKLHFVVLSGVAGGGRNTVINRLVQQDNFYFVVSDTTRPSKMRDGKMEENGIQYWFRSEIDVLEDIKDGKFLEAELIHNQQVSGISLRELEEALNTGRTAIAEVEFGGANSIARVNPKAHIIGLLPPSFGEWKRRLENREVMTNDEYANRMRTAEKVITNMLEHGYFHIVLNDSIDESVADIKKVIAGTYPVDKESRARQVAEEMLIAVKWEVKQFI
jgi:guanylate kinase